MTVADRIDLAGFRTWVAPTVVTAAQAYKGKHRRADRALMSWARMLYVARHRSFT